jgi:hypothetical protein
VALRYATPESIDILCSRGGHSSVASKTQTFRSRSSVILGSPPSIDAGETEAIIRAPLLAAFGTPPLLQFLYHYSRRKYAYLSLQNIATCVSIHYMNALTRHEKQLVLLLKIWIFCFAGGGLYFLLFQNVLIKQINFFSSDILKLNLPLHPESPDKFWLALTLSMMATITALSYIAQKDIRKNIGYVIPLLIAKFVSTFFFILFFFIHINSLAYIVGALTDGPIFIITLVFYIRAKKSTL